MRTLAEINAQLDELRKAKSIWCPHCGAEYRDEEYEAVTYHGYSDHGNAVEFTCRTCEEEFVVHERVERTYESFPKEADQDA